MRRISINRRAGLGVHLWEEDHKQSHKDINNQVHRQNFITVELFLVISRLLFYTVKNITLGRAPSSSPDCHRIDSESLNSRNRDQCREQASHGNLGTK